MCTMSTSGGASTEPRKQDTIMGRPTGSAQMALVVGHPTQLACMALVVGRPTGVRLVWCRQWDLACPISGGTSHQGVLVCFWQWDVPLGCASYGVSCETSLSLYVVSGGTSCWGALHMVLAVGPGLPCMALVWDVPPSSLQITIVVGRPTRVSL
jgi:hypothetical protein